MYFICVFRIYHVDNTGVIRFLRIEVIMPKVSTNINLDADLKKRAQELFADLGMDLTTAVTLFLFSEMGHPKSGK